MLDHNDPLVPNALFDVVVAINRHPDAHMIYSDEDQSTSIDEYGLHRAPFFKPVWSPETILGTMYSLP